MYQLKGSTSSFVDSRTTVKMMFSKLTRPQSKTTNSKTMDKASSTKEKGITQPTMALKGCDMLIKATDFKLPV